MERSEGCVVTVVADLKEALGRGANDALRGGGIPGEELDFGGLELDSGRGGGETEILHQRDGEGGALPGKLEVALI